MMTRKIISVGILAATLASCGENAAITPAKSKSTIKTVSGLNVVKIEDTTSWETLISGKNTKIEIPVFTVEIQDPMKIDVFDKNMLFMSQMSNKSALGTMNAESTFLNIGVQTLTVLADDIKNSIRLFGLKLGDLQAGMLSWRLAAAKKKNGVFNLTTAANKIFTVGIIVAELFDFNVPSLVNVTGDGALILDSASLVNTIIKLHGKAKLVFAKYDTTVVGAEAFLTRSVILGESAQIESQTAITIPAGHTLQLTAVQSKINLNGTSPADKILNNFGTLLQYAGSITGTIENSGVIHIKGGELGDIHCKNGSALAFGIKSNGFLTAGDLPHDATTGNLTFENGSKAILVTGHTLKTGSIKVTGSPTIQFIVMNNQTTPILDAGSNSVNLGSASINIIPVTAIKSGTVITLAKTTGALTFTGRLEDFAEFAHSNTGGVLTLTALKDITAIDLSTVATSATISNVGGFRSHKAGKLVGAKEASFAGATFAVAGDMNVSNGFSARDAQVQMNLGKTTFESNFTKTAGMDLTGTFNVFNSIDVAGFTLTNSASFATKNDSNVARFNEMGFMTGVSKKLRSNGFELTPSVSVGFAKLSDVSENVDGYSVQGASAGAYLADFSLDAGHAFKVAGLEMNVSGELSFGVKSAQSFELRNAFGEIMNAQVSNQNLGLSFGFTAKLDSKTSFYATAQTESYNNSKKMEFGLKF